MAWYWTLAPWAAVTVAFLAICRAIRRMERGEPRGKDRIEALADATREPRPRHIPHPPLAAADRPGTAASILLADEAEALAAVAVQLAAQPVNPASAAEGYRIADFLRIRIPDASDAEIGRAVLAMLWVAKNIAERSDDLVTGYGVLVESLCYAALHLTDLERTP